MKTPEVILQEIKDQVAFENDWIDWVCFKADCDITDIEIVTDIVAKRFAIEVAKEALNNAADNAKITGDWDNEIHDVVHSVDKESILSETNIPKL
ncbi:MAG TPA: hypothetical protein DEF78_11780 [Sphingobacterium sp.]|nr:hypothetical protein [Sphingobacterium sp.]